GLLGDKKAAHIQASGSVLSNGAFASREMSARHLDVVMEFLGVPSFETVYVEGMAASSAQAHEIKEKAIQQAVRLAERF
ncbi:Flavodoxin-like fold, partial [Paenibacillus sp. yr247]|uniref:NAD(P)H-dependent oxidoreductase n=1 Tax=Paenibacillus sp. yr247 TaxID=1761880 RepID=UPI0008919A5B